MCINSAQFERDAFLSTVNSITQMYQINIPRDLITVKSSRIILSVYRGLPSGPGL